MQSTRRLIAWGLALLLLFRLAGIGIGQAKQDSKTGETNTPPARGERKSTTLRPGDPAPNFTLPDVKKTKEVTLADFQGKKPVVLIFGSYT